MSVWGLGHVYNIVNMDGILQPEYMVIMSSVVSNTPETLFEDNCSRGSLVNTRFGLLGAPSIAH